MVPKFIREKRIEFLRNRLDKSLELKRKRIGVEVNEYFKNNISNHQTPEEQEVINFLANNPIAVFPYGFTKKYKPQDIVVYSDKNTNMKYVLHDNKRMYFPKTEDEVSIQRYYRSILVEQDMDSPHRYEYADFHVREGDIVADIGAAEGVFGLSVIEKIKKLYLFECKETWVEALKITFAPWKEKVIIVNKYISDHNDDQHITLDDFLNGYPINFIKADIEGAELPLLKGAKKTMSTQGNIRIVLCAYHKQNDEQDLKQILTEFGFQAESSKGYMIFLYDKNLSPPYLRRGVIRATKE